MKHSIGTVTPHFAAAPHRGSGHRVQAASGSARRPSLPGVASHAPTRPPAPRDTPTTDERKIGRVVRDAIALRARMCRSLDDLPVATPARREILANWLGLMPLPEPSGIDPIDLTIRIDGSAGRLTWAAFGSAASLADVSLDVFFALAVQPRERARFRAALARLRPQQVGTWLELSESGFDGGWCARGPTALAAAMSFAPVTTPHERLRAWASRRGVDTCWLVRRSVGDGTPFSDFVVDVPGATTAERIAMLGDVMDRVDARSLPGPVARAILDAEPSQLGLTVRLFADGLARIGAVVPEPTGAILDACDAATADPDREAVAMYQSALQAGSPSHVELSLMATGWDVTRYYAPRR